jgi:hypothetical protein
LGSHYGSAQAFLVALRFPGYFGCSFICRIFLSFSNHTFLSFPTISGVFLRSSPPIAFINPSPLVACGASLV